MGHRFLEIVGTPAVHAAQAAAGSRRSYARMESGPPNHACLGTEEAAFIAARDSFYVASVSATGWPYVQHRGGSAGFLQVLDPRLLGFADYPGNKQLVTLGNVATDDRVAIILMDYPARRRLKILGRIAAMRAGDDPGLTDRLGRPGVPSERLFLLRVEAFDWNCSQYITPRFTEGEIARVTAPLLERLRMAEAENADLTARVAELEEDRR